MTTTTIAEGGKTPGPRYARFTEHNGWEGETWHFYIPVEGNEAAIEALHAKLDEFEVAGTEGYELTPEDRYLSEAEVDTLVRHGSSENVTYMDEHNKLTGVLDPQKITDAKDFWKGALADMIDARGA